LFEVLEKMEMERKNCDEYLKYSLTTDIHQPLDAAYKVFKKKIRIWRQNL